MAGPRPLQAEGSYTDDESFGLLPRLQLIDFGFALNRSERSDDGVQTRVYGTLQSGAQQPELTCGEPTGPLGNL